MNEPTSRSTDAPLSSTLQDLDRFTPDGINALATVGLVLLDAVNQQQIVVNDDLSLPMFEAVRNVLCRTYPLQDALHGASDGLPDALTGFLAMVEEARQAKAEDIPEGVQQSGAAMGSIATAEDDPRDTPYFAAAGWQAQYFVVPADITEESALDGASMFLALASSIGNNADAMGDSARWAIVHFAEMAGALVDTVVGFRLKSRRA